MKNKASVFLKQIISVVTSVVKAKSMAVKNKTSAMKTRLLIFSLLKNKKVLMATISHKIHALIGKDDKKNIDNREGDHSQAIVLYKEVANESRPNIGLLEWNPDEEDYDEKYPDLTHSLFDSDDDEYGNNTGSVIDLVRNSKEDHGEDFRLEDEIDHVADLFIRRFHRQIKLQKQESFKRYQDMLQRGV